MWDGKNRRRVERLPPDPQCWLDLGACQRCITADMAEEAEILASYYPPEPENVRRARQAVLGLHQRFAGEPRYIQGIDALLRCRRDAAILRALETQPVAAVARRYGLSRSRVYALRREATTCAILLQRASQGV